MSGLTNFMTKIQQKTPHGRAFNKLRSKIHNADSEHGKMLGMAPLIKKKVNATARNTNEMAKKYQQRASTLLGG